MTTEPTHGASQTPGPHEVLSGALAALLQVPELTDRLVRAMELAQTSRSVEPEPLPKAVRPSLRQLAAALALSPSLEELLKLSASLDFRDLKEPEIAYLEEVHLHTVRRWRMDGTGPEYRNQGVIRYPIRLYWEWREKGRQKMTAQKMTKGRKP
jgi:hypothetical protein